MYTDHDICWSEIEKHGTTNADGKTTVNIVAGIKVYLPKKAEELGRKQAYVEAFHGMRQRGFSDIEAAKILGLTGEQARRVSKPDSVYQFRIIPTTEVVLIRESAAESFMSGYDQTYEIIAGRMESVGVTDVASVRRAGIAVAMAEIREMLPDDIYQLYCELYGKVV